MPLFSDCLDGAAKNAGSTEITAIVITGDSGIQVRCRTHDTMPCDSLSEYITKKVCQGFLKRGLDACEENRKRKGLSTLLRNSPIHPFRNHR